MKANGWQGVFTVFAGFRSPRHGCGVAINIDHQQSRAIAIKVHPIADKKRWFARVM
jgi:hypothetical protein